MVYLKENQIGASSKIVYGFQGTKVKIINHCLNMRLVQNENGLKFWVNINNLSDVPVERNTYEEQKVRETKSAKSMAKKRR